MNDNDHSRWSDDIPAYMLGALEPAEALELERHLADCERCRADIRWLAPAVQVLPEAVERVEPPRELRSRLVERHAVGIGHLAGDRKRHADRRAFFRWRSGLRIQRDDLAGGAGSGRAAGAVQVVLVILRRVELHD